MANRILLEPCFKNKPDANGYYYKLSFNESRKTVTVRLFMMYKLRSKMRTLPLDKEDWNFLKKSEHDEFQEWYGANLNKIYFVKSNK